MALGLLALCCLVSEGSAGNWSAVYLRNNLRIPSGFAVSGFAAFSVAMTVGRLLGDRLAARFGPVRLVRGCGLLAATGLAGGLVSGKPVAAVAGFALFGAGLSCTIPQLLSAAGNADPDQPGTGLARVSALGYVGLVGGPVLIGACAGLTGLPLALGIPVVLGLFVAAGARVLDPLRRPGITSPESTPPEGMSLESGPPESVSLESAPLESMPLESMPLGRTPPQSAPPAQLTQSGQFPLESAGRAAQERHRRVVAADRAHSAAATGARTAEHEPRMPGLHAPRARVGELVSPRP
jgi:MFS family permease